MSRPGAWGRVFSNLKKYITNDWSHKSYVGEDSLGHKFYEIKNSRQNVSRGFEPPKHLSDSTPGLEWQSWLKGTRRFPPSEEEIFMNQRRQQAQLAQDAATEKRAPIVGSTGPGAGDHGPKPYPKYSDLEDVPGHRKQMRFLALALLVVAAAAHSEEPPKEDDSPIKFISKERFEANIAAGKSQLTVFATPQCPHCIAVTKELEQAREQIDESVIIAKIDLSQEENRPLGVQYKVQGVPSIFYITTDADSAVPYDGDRSAASLVAFVKRVTEKPVTEIKTKDEFEALAVVSAESKPRVVIMGGALLEYLKDAVARLADFDAYIVSAELAKEMGNDEKNVLLVTVTGEKVLFPVEKINSEADIIRFIKVESLPLVASFPKQAREIFGAGLEYVMFYFSDGPVSKIDEKHFLSKIGSEHRGKLQIAHVDTTEEETKQVVEYFQATGESTVRIYHFPSNDQYRLPEGAAVEEAAVSKLVFETLQGMAKPHLKSAEQPADWDALPVKVLVGSTLDAARSQGKTLVVMYFAPWCGHCKAIKPIWDELGQHYEDKEGVVIAKMDATENDVSDGQPRIGGFPTIRLYHADGKLVDEYSGERTKDGFIAAIDAFVAKEAKKEEKHEEL